MYPLKEGYYTPKWQLKANARKTTYVGGGRWRGPGTGWGWGVARCCFRQGGNSMKFQEKLSQAFTWVAGPTNENMIYEDEFHSQRVSDPIGVHPTTSLSISLCDLWCVSSKRYTDKFRLKTEKESEREDPSGPWLSTVGKLSGRPLSGGRLPPARRGVPTCTRLRPPPPAYPRCPTAAGAPASYCPSWGPWERSPPRWWPGSAGRRAGGRSAWWCWSCPRRVRRWPAPWRGARGSRAPRRRRRPPPGPGPRLRRPPWAPRPRSSRLAALGRARAPRRALPAAPASPAGRPNFPEDAPATPPDWSQDPERAVARSSHGAGKGPGWPGRGGPAEDAAPRRCPRSPRARPELRHFLPRGVSSRLGRCRARPPPSGPGGAENPLAARSGEPRKFKVSLRKFWGQRASSESPGSERGGAGGGLLGEGAGLGVNHLPWLFPERVWHWRSLP